MPISYMLVLTPLVSADSIYTERYTDLLAVKTHPRRVRDGVDLERERLRLPACARERGRQRPLCELGAPARHVHARAGAQLSLQDVHGQCLL